MRLPATSRSYPPVDGWCPSGEQYHTLLGVTGSGKTYTIANVIQNVQASDAGAHP